jgi:phosphoadenosine phosphosulfate reductase
MLFEREPEARVFALDTHVLFPETYALWRQVEQRYKTRIDVYEGPSLGRQAAVHGEALWGRNPNLCCTIRKVEPLTRALADVDCWITGIRRDQSPTRATAAKLGWDEQHEVWKANPLADWSDADVWAYIRERDLPVNELHHQGYASIGCTHCTRPGEGRAGRWSGIEKTECGLHPPEAQ